MAKNQQPLPLTTLELHFKNILDQLDTQMWTIQTLFEALKGSGYPFLIVLLSLPFCQPIQIPGFSTPFGIVIIFIGLRMAFGHHIWWPQWVLRRPVSPKLIKVVILKSLRCIQFLKGWLHIRWSRLCTDSLLYRLHGGFVIFMGLYLAIPFPIPFSNMLFAWALLLLGLGLIEDDGLFVCLGYGIGCLGITILGFIIYWLHAWATT